MKCRRGRGVGLRPTCFCGLSYEAAASRDGEWESLSQTLIDSHKGSRSVSSRLPSFSDDDQKPFIADWPSPYCVCALVTPPPTGEHGLGGFTNRDIRNSAS